VSCIVGSVVLVVGYYLLRRFFVGKNATIRNFRQHGIATARAEVVGRSYTMSHSEDFEQISVSIEVVNPQEEPGSAIGSEIVVTASIIV